MVAAGIDGGAPVCFCFRNSKTVAFLVRRVGSRHYARIRITFCCTRCWASADPARFQKAANYILKNQNEDGGWPIYAGGPSNISASVKAYFGLKLAGYTADHPALANARKKILAMGGITEVNTFTKIYLCFFGQYDYDAVPAIPPEIVLFPNWFWFNIYEISSWSRAILVPLSIAYAKKPFKKIPREMGVEELFVGGMREVAHASALVKKKLVLVAEFLSRARSHDALVRAGTCSAAAIDCVEEQAEKGMLARFEMSDGLGADLSVDDECDHRAALPGIFIVDDPASDSRAG